MPSEMSSKWFGEFCRDRALDVGQVWRAWTCQLRYVPLDINVLSRRSVRVGNPREEIPICTWAGARPWPCAQPLPCNPPCAFVQHDSAAHPFKLNKERRLPSWERRTVSRCVKSARCSFLVSRRPVRLPQCPCLGRLATHRSSG